MGRRDRMGEMKAFFEGVGEGWASGVWEKAPTKPKEKRKGKTLITNKPKDVVAGSIVEDV
jgi:chlorophyllide a reductase subunit Y